MAVDTWEQVATNQVSTTFNAITYGGSQFLAVGFDGFVFTSPDGATWTQHNHLNNAEYNGVAYGNGRFVMAGVFTPVLSSTDGITWQAESIGTDKTMYGAFFGNNKFILTGPVGLIYTSPDGHMWTEIPRPTTSRLNAATYGNGLFVIAGHGGTILTSPDAVNWTLQAKLSNDALVSVTFGNGVFVASSLGGEILTSSNGVDWSAQNLAGAFTPLYGVAWGNGSFVAVGDQAFGNTTNGAELWSSVDGSNWARRNAVVNKTFYGVAFGGDRFVGAGVSGSIIRSNEVVSTAVASRFINLSNRALVGTGDDILIGSLILTDAPLRVYARVAGASLPAAITNPLLNPELEVIKLGTPNTSIGSNDNWRSNQEALIMSTGIPPSNDNEPAIVANLLPGIYSIVVRGVGDTTGFANVEIYEFKDPAASEHGSIINLSNRAFVGTGDDILIGSLIIQGDTARRIYARVAGPTLPAAITNPLLDPELELVQVLGTGNVPIDTNDNWKDSQQALIESTGIPPSNDNEPAIVATLQPGTYSIVVRGVGGTQGFANVEIYDFPE